MGRRGLRAARRVMGQRAKDRGKSERWAVTARIGDDVLHPKGALTSAWCGRAKAYAESPQQEASKYATRASRFCGLPQGWHMGSDQLAHRTSSREETADPYRPGN